MFIAELNHPMFDMFDLTSLRTLMASALPDRTDEAVIEDMHITHHVYGMTETSPGITHSTIEDSLKTLHYSRQTLSVYRSGNYES